MPTFQSLDELIANKAAEFADQIKAAAAMADKEEEIRIEAEKQLAFIQKEAGIKLEGKHEYTVASGRIDSVYDRVIIEYKNPSSPGARIGPKADSPGTKKVVEQIKKRFYDLRQEHGQALNSLFGVGLDGNHFVFVRYREDQWQVQDPVEVNKHSAERFLWALFNLGSKGRPFSPEYLALDFGAASSTAQQGIRTLYSAISTTANPKAQTFFSQWKILFGEVCGYDVTNPTEKLKTLADFYSVPTRGFRPAELLFAVHTYYAIFMKLLASEIVAFFHKLPTPLQKMMQSTTTNKLRREVEDLEAGSIFRHFGITNFLEGDLFSWYVAVWSDEVEMLVRNLVLKLDGYNPGTLSEDPAGSRDLLKRLYQELFPKTVRHDLGEYYTPDWLAEHVLNETAYSGDPDKRLLDPACGSGTFLISAINRIRKWFDSNREECRFDEGELCAKILSNVIGFDLNPLAVMAARTNYLIAIKDLLGRVARVEIPVYLCDSILTPTEHGGLFTGALGQAKELKTAAARFLIPTEIADHREDVAKYAEQLEFCVQNGYSPSEFLDRCRDEGIAITADTLHKDLYRELVALDKANKNGVWARIIKNSFAPVFVGRSADYVIGNPPWIRWNYLPGEYRADVSALWARYGLFAQKGYLARLGTAEMDFSMLYAYACIDSFLVQGGQLGFVITLEVVKSKGAGTGFRRFQLGQDGEVFKVFRLDDMVALKPFDAANKTAALFCMKGKKTRYPVEYIRWSKKVSAFDFRHATDLDAVLQATRRENLVARPIAEPTSPWQTVSISQTTVMDKLKGSSPYKAHSGVAVDPYGVYLLRSADGLGRKATLLTNAADLGDLKVEPVTCKIESDLLYPAVRGRDIRRWSASPELYVLAVNRSPRKQDQTPESAMRKEHPLAWQYLLRFKRALLNRGKLWAFYGKDTELRHLPADTEQLYFRHKQTSSARSGGVVVQQIEVPFYAMRDIGPYSFLDYKVAWQMGASEIKAAVLKPIDTPAGKRPILPCTGTVSYIGFTSLAECHYVCACMNSSIGNAYFKSFSSAGRGMGAPSILKRINIPAFDKQNPLHRDLSAASELCHTAAKSGDDKELSRSEMQIDRLVAKLWGITGAESATVVEGGRVVSRE